MFRRVFYVAVVVVLAAIAWTWTFWPPILWSLLVLGPLILLGLYDALQRRRTVLRNWPLIGRFRYVFESIRPEIQQYFIESDTDGRPLNRVFRTVVYQRAKGALSTVPFGTQFDVYQPGYEWLSHSLQAKAPPGDEPRVRIGGQACTKPYDASHLNISAMSYGSLSKAAVRALNRGAKAGGFAHNTGEGGISPYHLSHGGDLIWQIGTGYFGCRSDDGGFDPGRYREEARRDEVKMVELKLSQGAKPGHGGILPARKVTPEIARIRGVPLGKDVLSPPSHRVFDTPVGLLEFIEKLRQLSGGKPVGFKLCVGDRVEFFSICKAMRETDIAPDFISVDGGEGGTGAAPLEFSNSVGWPMREGVVFVHNALVAAGLRDRVRVIASGKIITGFHVVRALAMGADLCASARGMMLALGCIQALRCNSNHCPVGITTQNPALVAGLDVEDKGTRVFRYHHDTIESLLELIAAAGLDAPYQIEPHHVWRRVSERVSAHYGDIYPYQESGSLLQGNAHPTLQREWDRADASTFQHADADV